MIKITELIQTCNACPTQYEGKTEGGDYVYIRFRWGRLSMQIAGKTIYSEVISDTLDGFISLDKIKEKLSDLNIEWPL